MIENIKRKICMARKVWNVSGMPIPHPEHMSVCGQKLQKTNEHIEYRLTTNWDNVNCSGCFKIGKK